MNLLPKRLKHIPKILVCLFIAYLFIPMEKGPFDVVIHAPDNEVGYFVARLIVKGRPDYLYGGHAAVSPLRITLYEQSKIVKANEPFTFDSIYLSGGLFDKQYRLYVYQPGYTLPTGLYYELNNNHINELHPIPWEHVMKKLSDGITHDELGIINRDFFWVEDRIRQHYIPVMLNEFSKELVWNEFKRTPAICTAIYQHDYEYNPDCSEAGIKSFLKWK